MGATTVTPTPHQLKALTHPVRLRMLGMLRLEGPATATTLAVRLGLNTGATSYHLRQLAQHGFVEEATDLGNARDRWWKAAHRSTTTANTAPEPEAKETLEAYLQTVAVVMTEQLQAMTDAASSQQHILDELPRLLPNRAFLNDKEIVSREADVQDWLKSILPTSPVTGKPYKATVLTIKY